MIRGKKINELLAAKTTIDQVAVNGWVRQKRVGKSVIFLELNDGSIIHNLQVVVEQGSPFFEEAGKLLLGSCVQVSGALHQSLGSGQKIELKCSGLKVWGSSTDDYPLQKKRHTFEFLRSIAHLRVRSNTFGAVFRIRSAAAFAIHEFFQERGFYYVHTPIITGSDCEGAGEMFHVTTLPLEDIPKVKTADEHIVVDYSQDFFKKETGLTVSGQLEGELFAQALSDIYTFGPTFRAENSNTPRHVAEFWMIEPEMAFYDLEDDVSLAEAFIKQVTQRVMDRCTDDIAFCSKFVDKTLMDRLNQVVSEKFEIMTYTEAVDALERSKKKFDYPVYWGADLQTEHERYLTEELVKKPLFVINYPTEIKAFYMRQNDDGKTVAAMDLLVPRIGEIIGGSQREERMTNLMDMITRKNLDASNYWWYLDTRKYGTAPHSGFGLGFARLLLYLTGMVNIRDVIPFPRTPGHADF